MRAWKASAATAIVAGLLSIGCAAAPPPAPRGDRELIMSYDDARASGPMAFPTQSYESVVRFQLPDGEHKPLRLRFQAEAAGQLEITIYDSTVLETPGDPIHKVVCDLSKDDLSNGRDGRWVVENLADMKPVKGVVWIGVHKTGGAPTIWASSVVSGHAFIRNNDPSNAMGLLPTKRTPMLRLEIVPDGPQRRVSSDAASTDAARLAARRWLSRPRRERWCHPLPRRSWALRRRRRCLRTELLDRAIRAPAPACSGDASRGIRMPGARRRRAPGLPPRRRSSGHRPQKASVVLRR